MWKTEPMDLLQTKLIRPHIGEPLIARPALIGRLAEAAARRLTVLIAPAGYGKTALVSQWLTERQKVKGKRQNATGESELLPFTFELLPSPPQVAWLTLDASDNDPAGFWRYVIAACGQIVPGFGAPALATLARPEPLQVEALLAFLLNELAGLQHRGVLVLDDYHTITAPEIHEAMAFLVARLPASLHLVVLARSEPPLLLAQLRARGDLVELRAEALRFSPDESAALLQHLLPSAPPELVRELVARAEGWPAGLRLAALSVVSRPAATGEPTVEWDAGAHAHVAAYLVAEVLDALPTAVQTFVLETSGLPRLCPALCDAVTGRDDGAAMVRALTQGGLFISALDQEWHRYQPLFAEAMRYEARQRLGVERLRTLDARASAWFASQGMPVEAVEAALAARAYLQAVALIEALLARGTPLAGLPNLRRWVEQLPETVLPASPTICLAYAQAVLFTDDRTATATLARVEALLDHAERAWRADDDAEHLGQALTVRAMALWWHGEQVRAAVVSRHALALLPASALRDRAICEIHLATAALRDGRLAQAEPPARAAQQAFAQTGDGYGQRAALFVLADIATQQGEYGQAESLYRHIIAVAGADRADQASAIIGLAGLAYRHNELDAAEAAIAEALVLAEQHVGAVGVDTILLELLEPAVLLRARIQQARRAWAEAQRDLADLAARTLQHPQALLRRLVRLEQARLSLNLGDWAAVRRWASATAEQPDDLPRLLQEREAMLVARWLIAEGDASAALRALERWRAEAQADGRLDSELELLVLIALAQQSGGQMPQAVETLLELLPQLWARNLSRVLLDAGPPMGRLLWLVQERLGTRGEDGLPTWLATILAKFPAAEAAEKGAHTQKPRDLATLLAEPLSPQEQRVLRLLGAGLSNPEIADELVVSINTIKTHLQSIYRKLGVTSRREARALIRKG